MGMSSAHPGMLGLSYLGKNYAAAALLAVNNASNPLYESGCGVGWKLVRLGGP